MIKYRTLRVPVDDRADTVAVYVLRGAQTLDVLGFDIDAKGKLTPRFQPVDLIPSTKGDPHDNPPA